MSTFFHLKGVCFNNDGIAVGHIQNKKRPSKYEFFGYLVNLAGGGLLQKIGRFIAPVVKDTIQDKADRIVGDYGCFAGFGKKPE